MRDQSKPALAMVGQNGSRPAVPARAIPGNLAVKCPKCREVLVGKDWEKNLKVCPRCQHHSRLTAWERITLLADGDSWHEFGDDLRTADPLRFENNLHPYPQEIQAKRDATKLDEAAVIVRAAIDDLPVVLAVLDFAFIGGSMGSVVGEKVTLAIEAAEHDRVPLIIVSASGGARMQEGMFALMQMAKTSAALAKLAEAGVPYISVLTDPTTGGTLASYAFLGDVILAEPGAFIGFAGPRVIEQAIHTKLPAGTNSSEFVLQHGMIDAIVPRSALKPALSRLVKLYRGAQGAES
ncbi:MAG TPA: acetyl-CoA carboxylase, carboxyltransferase subunit beta [Ktedonobacterales bacterium]|nr:acetyl-CoA carboxylase, carboxyltransferase subunit beta [Ktedonobacterales bacterium]